MMHYRCALPGFEETPGHPVSELRRRLAEVAITIDGPLVASPLFPATNHSAADSMGHLVDEAMGFGGEMAAETALETYASAATSVVAAAAHAGLRMLKGGGQGENSVDMGDLQSEYDTDFACNPKHADSCAHFPEGTRCMYFDANPNSGITSFDSVPMAAISFMQSISFDDWATPMYILMAAMSPYTWVYFVLIVMIGGFFVVNLFLAVIFMEYGAAQEAVKEEARATARNTARSQRSDTARSSAETARDSQRSAEGAPLIGDGSELSEGVLKEPPRRCDDCSTEGWWRHPFKVVSGSAWLGNTSTGLVLFNMVLMCMPYDGMSEEYAQRIEDMSSGV